MRLVSQQQQNYEPGFSSGGPCEGGLSSGRSL